MKYVLMQSPDKCITVNANQIYIHPFEDKAELMRMEQAGYKGVGTLESDLEAEDLQIGFEAVSDEERIRTENTLDLIRSLLEDN